MYLKRLELLGFKSFPDKTIIKFTPGVTSIVGPNGCGKTNILDSIRWVLGEQRVSLLRGSKMEEVIFNGTHDIKPLGMSEVTLVVQNNKGVLPTEYSEVQITRRLFRSGESEYLLNKIPCRLKDIADLLMDTGVGSHIYSVIQADMVEAILSDRADERRFLFEEAAGISKYKYRKKAAIRKLEATEGDLLRLKDIVAEVTTQVNTLKRQMNKAQRYKILSEELKGWELYLSKNAIDELSKERRELLAQRDALFGSKMKYDAEITTLSALQEEERTNLTELDRRLSEISNLIYEKSEAAHGIEKEITILRERRDNSRQLKERNALDIEAFKKRRIILLDQIEQIENDMRKLDDDLIGMESALLAAESRLAATDNEVLSARCAKEEANKSLMGLEGQLSAGKSDDTNLKEQKTDIEAGFACINRQTDELHGGEKSLLEIKTSLENELSDFRDGIKKTQSARANIEADIISLNQESEESSGRIYELSASLEAAEARRHLLQEMVAHYEGFSSGVASIMQDRQRWPGLIGTVADNLTPKPGFGEAVEAALGEFAGFMICKDRSSAENIISYLKNESKGKAGFLVLENAGNDSVATRPALTGDGFIGWADEHVIIPDNLRILAGLLLSRIAIVDANDHESIINQLPPYFSAVTTDGLLFRGRAIVSGGSHEGLSLLGREDKIAEQMETIRAINDELEKVKNIRNKITAGLGSKQAELNSTISSLDDLKENVEKSEKELARISFEFQAIANDLIRVEKDRKELAAKLEILNNRQFSLNLSYDQLAHEKERLLAILNDHDARIKELEDKSAQVETDYSDLQIKQVELRSQKQQMESQIRHTRELVSEIDGNTQKETDEMYQAGIDIDAAGEKIIRLEKELKITFDERTEISEKQLKIRENHDAFLERLNAREKDIKTLRQSREEANTRLHTAEIRMAEVDAESKNIIQNVRDEYDIDAEQISPIPPSTEVSQEDRASHIQELKERLKDLGAVNLLALEEYDTTRERQEFLSAQMEDLFNAKSTLQSTITKINQTARNLFLETFGQVRTNFKQVFAELFTGGEADVRLIDETDPLESPIEISARPRGKKLLSIAQMSGGERALTAISLLFAIYLVKPSPFCILDEIDAPLDDANIHRFLRIIRTFSEQTQFIIITHNKITMEAADILYGVTMEQPGVSKVVSVRFNEDEEELINTAIGTDSDAFKPETSDHQ